MGAGTLTLLAAVGVAQRFRHGSALSAAPSVAPAAGERLPAVLPTLGEVPPFTFTNVDGRAIDPAALRGHVWIADLIFTRCVTTCPVTTAKMNVLRRSMRSSEIRFVSFSIDPEYDTPEVLRAYAARWGADPRWLLLSGPNSQVVEFTKALDMPFKRTAMPDEPIMHSSLFFLIDQRGQLRGQYNSLEDASVRRLAADAALLEGAGETPSLAGRSTADPHRGADGPRGEALFHSLGCPACHLNPKLGPPLAGLAGRTVRLEDGATAVADASYLRQSILSPSEKVVQGYNHLMPAYADFLVPGDVDDLVAYLQSMPKGAE